MSGKQNLTVRLSAETIRKAKILAAERNTSVTQLLSDYVEQMVGEHRRFEEAKEAALAYLETGFHLGGKVRASREELHER